MAGLSVCVGWHGMHGALTEHLSDGGMVLHSFISFFYVLFFVGTLREPLCVAGTAARTARGDIRAGEVNMGACAQLTVWASSPHASPLAPQHTSAGRPYPTLPYHKTYPFFFGFASRGVSTVCIEVWARSIMMTGYY